MAAVALRTSSFSALRHRAVRMFWVGTLALAGAVATAVALFRSRRDQLLVPAEGLAS